MDSGWDQGLEKDLGSSRHIAQSAQGGTAQPAFFLGRLSFGH